MVVPTPCVWCSPQAELEEGKKKELMSAIQAHFKEWLQATGAMRQVGAGRPGWGHGRCGQAWVGTMGRCGACLLFHVAAR